MPSYNVASLLQAAPGAVENHPLAIPELEVADDIHLVAPIEGEVKLSHTGRSILARGELSTAIEGYCGRCLRAVVTPLEVRFEEEALPSIDIDTGLPLDQTAEPDALRLDDHHELDLAIPIREAISLAEPIIVLCRPDCRGLCPDCGLDMNDNPSHSHIEDAVDPRLAALAEWQAPTDGD